MNFFTSDTHFGSERTLTLSMRPFRSTEDMDNTIIDNINSSMTPEDILYHIGDFGNYKVVKELKPKVILTCGNYEMNDCKKLFDNDFEKFREHLLELGFSEVYPYNHNVGGMFLVHYPSIRNKDVFTLFGHIHRGQMVKKNALNVGVDVHHYKPVSMKEVEFWKNAIVNFYDNDVFCE